MIAITVEDEKDIEKFKDYTPSKSETAVPETEKPSEPEAPEKQTSPAPAVHTEKKVSEPSQKSPAGDRIFASPLARKLAEDKNVGYTLENSLQAF